MLLPFVPTRLLDHRFSCYCYCYCSSLLVLITTYENIQFLFIDKGKKIENIVFFEPIDKISIYIDQYTLLNLLTDLLFIEMRGNGFGGGAN